MSDECYIHGVSTLCALGTGNQEVARSLFAADKSPLTVSSRYGERLHLGQVEVAASNKTIPPQHNSRNNRMLQRAASPLLADIEALQQRYGAHRIGVVIGSSTSGIYEGEEAALHYHDHSQGKFPAGYWLTQQEIGAPALFLSGQLGLTGPAWTISTACTSGAKALASGRRLLRAGVCDAVIAGGADSLCRLTIQGFSALGAVSKTICSPFSSHRDGINIGEGAALFILSREPSGICISGCGESSDAHHISAPDPVGKGAELAMRQALRQAGIGPEEIDYINLHGTGTTQNDAMESAAVYRVFGAEVNCSSTKSLTGHTLGTAGALEAAFCYFALEAGKLPRQLDTGPAGKDIAPLKNLFHHKQARKPVNAMSNSFAFGGNNVSLILSRRSY
ncbi:MAG: beta-ketoacyl-ACP synthase [Pseudomonadales bacterium]